MNYSEFKQKRDEAVSALPIFYAFNDKQFEEGMKNLGLNADELNLILSLGGGGYIKKTDRQMIIQSFKDAENDFAELMKDDTFFIDAVSYELGNHEFCITYDPSDALAAVSLSIDAVNADERMKKLYFVARAQYLEGANQ